MIVKIPVSIGELFDKISILEIKAEIIRDQSKLDNVRVELEKLATVGKSLGAPKGFSAVYSQLKCVNQKLWNIEDDIRQCERESDLGDRFVELARSVYFTNDERSRIKREINSLFGSELVEEKSYASY